MNQKYLSILSSFIFLFTFGFTQAQTPFEVLSPADGTVARVEGLGSNTLTATWSSNDTLPGTVTYKWLVDAPGGSFANPIASLPSDLSGADTNITLPFLLIANLLEQNGVNVGDTITLDWKAQASNGTDSVLTSNTHSITLIRGGIIDGNFDQLNPTNGSSFTIAGAPFQEIVFDWNSVGEGVTYRWILQAGSPPFQPVTEVFSRLAPNNGLDTVDAINYGVIDQILENNGINVGASVPNLLISTLQWKIRAIAGNDSIESANAPFDISLTRGTLDSSFFLLSPANNALLDVSGDSTQTIDIVWESADSIFNAGGTTYEWIYDINQPGIPSNNGGTDTVLTLSYAQIDQLLGANGVNYGDTLTLNWTVKAVNGTDSLLADNFFTVDLVRSGFFSFNLLSPPDNFVLTVEGAFNNEAVITWSNAGTIFNSYEWVAGIAGPVFAPLTSLPSGGDTNFVFTYGELDDLMDALTVPAQGSTTLSWTVEASTANNYQISANDTFNITLNRGLLLEAFNQASPTNGTALTVQGNAANTVDISWGSSNPNATYVWLASSATALDFDNPLLAVPSNNSGADTMLTLDFGSIDAELANLGITVGQTANLSWTVAAIGGNDTLLSSDTFNIDITRGVVFNDFNLLNPADGSTVNVEGSAMNEAVIDWQSAGNGLTYEWRAYLGGNFMAPALSFPSDNSGADTTLTLSFGAIDGVLESLSVPVGGAATIDWTVKASNSTDSIFALDTFSVTLNRGVVLQSFTMASPTNNASFTVEGLSSTVFDIIWNESQSGASYTWLANPTADFSNPLLAIPSNNGGADTSLTLTFGAIDQVLADAGLSVGQSVTLNWTVLAEAAGDSLFSVDTFLVTLTRGNVLFDYNLISPPNGANLVLEGLPTNTADIVWENAGSNTTYNWLAYAAGNFGAPILRIPSNSLGADTVLTLDFGTVDAILANAGVPVGGSLPIDWTVTAANGVDSLRSLDTFRVVLTRGALLQNYNLLSPADGTSLTVSGAATNTVDIVWENSVSGAQYSWLADAGTNFSTPLLDLFSNNSGSDTVLTLDYATLDNVLANQGLSVGQSVTLNWTVRALSAGDTLFAADTFAVTLVRGTLFETFNLLAPGSNLVPIRGVSENAIQARWERSTAGLSYIWQLDSVLANFQTPIVSIPTGTDTFLNLDYAQIEDVLDGLGLPLTTPIGLKWRVLVTDGIDSAASNNERSLNFTRGTVIRPFDLLAPANNFVLPLQGLGTQSAQVLWQNSSITNTATYTWSMDTLGGDFSNPLLTITPGNNATDTSFSLDFSAIDDFVATQGVGNGGTLSTIWRVRANSQIDNRFSEDTFRLDFNRGLVLKEYGLISPSNNSNLNIQGNDTTELTIRWDGAGIQGITYEWILDTVNGNFTTGLLNINTNTDTFVNLTRASLLSFLQSQGVAFGAFTDLQWTVRAFGGGDTLYSLDTFDLRISRGTVLQSYNQLSPANNTVLDLTDDGNQTVTINWETGADGNPSYRWLLDVPGGDFSAPLANIVSNNNGNDTALTLTYSQIDALLSSLNVLVGDTVDLIWTARAEAGNEVRDAANGPFNITIIRNTVLNEFNILSPASGTSLAVTGAGTNVVVVNWESAGEGNISYSWELDAPGGNFSAPLASIPSNQSGQDTFLILTYQDIDGLLASLGLNPGDSVDAIWTVRAANANTDILAANTSFAIRLRRGNVLNPFTVLGPANGTFAAVQGNGDQTVDISWNSAGLGNYNYEWVLDLRGGNFSPPLEAIPSNNNGQDTTLTLEFRAINALLASLGLNVGDTVEASWSVRATDGVDILLASNRFDITLRRGVITVPFNLLGPGDSTQISIPDASSSVLSVLWENADETGAKDGLVYNWILDEAGGDFSSPLATVPSASVGRETFLDLPYSQITALLNNNGVNIDESIETIWTVRGTEGDLLVEAEQVHALTIVRVEAVGNEELNATQHLYVYPNPATDFIRVAISNSQLTGADVRVFDLQGKEHSVTISSRSENEVQLSTAGLAAGVYVVHVNNGEVKATQRIIVK